jgi:hypothetical protein
MMYKIVVIFIVTSIAFFGIECLARKKKQKIWLHVFHVVFYIYSSLFLVFMYRKTEVKQKDMFYGALLVFMQLF